jgi:hypothetical protein
VEGDWVALPGGELEGRRPVVRCPDCREKQVRAARLGQAEPSEGREALCFSCYRAGIARDRALKAAREKLTASERQFQWTLPFEPVDRVRLARLKIERAGARAAARVGVGKYVDQRRRAQIEARHALQRIAGELRLRHASPVAGDRARTAALHAAEVQLPPAWLPFVASR